MCWTTAYTRKKTMTNKPKNTTQYLSSSFFLCMVSSNTYCVVFFVLFCLSSSFFLSMVSFNTYCVVFFGFKTKNTTQYVLDDTIHKKKDGDKQNKKHNTICVGRHHTQEKRRRQTNQKTQHNMRWTTPSNTYCVVFFGLFVFFFFLVYGVVQHILCCVFCFVCLLFFLVYTIHKKKDEDKQNKKHNTICVGRHHTQYKGGRQTNQKTQHNMCWTTPYTRKKTMTNKTKNYGVVQHIFCCVFCFVCHRLFSCVWCRPTHIVLCFLVCLYSSFFLCMVSSNTYCVAQYVLDDTIHKTKEEDKQNKKHNTICVGRHHTQEKRR
jgi:Ca2+/Na+ antiporter